MTRQLAVKLSLAQRLMAKFAWGRLMKREQFRRWAPVIATGTLIVSTVLKVAGQQQAADTLDYLIALVRLEDASPVPRMEVVGVITPLLAALAAAWGLVRKVLSEIRKARGAGRALPGGPAAAAALLLGLALQGCASVDGMRIGSQRQLQQPDRDTTLSFVCRGDEAGAVDYLYSAEFRWLGESGRKERLEAARAAKTRGECPCAGKSCS
jgi:hypothetical protein